MQVLVLLLLGSPPSQTQGPDSIQSLQFSTKKVSHTSVNRAMLGKCITNAVQLHVLSHESETVRLWCSVAVAVSYTAQLFMKQSSITFETTITVLPLCVAGWITAATHAVECPDFILGIIALFTEALVSKCAHIIFSWNDITDLQGLYWWFCRPVTWPCWSWWDSYLWYFFLPHLFPHNYCSHFISFLPVKSQGL